MKWKQKREEINKENIFENVGNNGESESIPVVYFYYNFSEYLREA